jgi:hypothetical protein
MKKKYPTTHASCSMMSIPSQYIWSPVSTIVFPTAYVQSTDVAFPVLQPIDQTNSLKHNLRKNKSKNEYN